MIIHLVDGTYELFRCYYGNKRSGKSDDRTGAVRLVLRTLISMAEDGGTHFGVATDHVIESFRNALWPGYKTGEGVEAALLSQFHPLEDALSAFGFVVWPMVELEADDALASAALAADSAAEVEKVCIWSPDKDLAQCVVGSRVVQVDRRHGITRNESEVVAKFGVKPESIPDYLAVVGDSADGFPGLPGWGPKAAALTFSNYPHLEDVPKDWRRWDKAIRGAQRLAGVLSDKWDEALLYRTLATLQLDVPVFETVDDLQWRGPGADFRAYCQRLESPSLFSRAAALSTRG